MHQMHQSCTNFRQEYEPRLALKESKPSMDSILFLRVLSFFIEKQTSLNRSAKLLFISFCDVLKSLLTDFRHIP